MGVNPMCDDYLEAPCRSGVGLAWLDLGRREGEGRRRSISVHHSKLAKLQKLVRRLD